MDLNIAWVAFVFGIFLHALATVWWAAKVNTLLGVVQVQLSDLIIELKAMKELYVRKDDAARESQMMISKIEAAWKRIDKITEKIGGA